jgi:ribosome-associated protein
MKNKTPRHKELNAAIETLDDKKADQITVLDLEEKSSVARYFVIASATSQTHLNALRYALEERWKKKFDRRLKSEARAGSGWQVVDLGDILVHLFTEEERHRYNLEGLWGDAKLLRMSA